MIGLIEHGIAVWGASTMLAGAGLLVGMLFGFMAQRSQFCLRAAVIEFATGRFGERLSVWLLAFSAALLGVQLMITAGLLEVAQSRALSATGSISGAVIGGLCFGTGMVLARGCASRLLVLSASGNARALLAGLIFVVAVQSSFQGALAPLRMAVSEIWIIDGGAARNILARNGLPADIGLVLGFLLAIVAAVFAVRASVKPIRWLAAIGAGTAIPLAYVMSYQIGLAELDPTTVRGITFSGPSAEILMRILGNAPRSAGFDTGLVPGVFLGAGFGALIGHEWRIQVFEASTGTLRYIFGAILMGFGAMSAGGCAVGAGVTGGVIFSLTAWVALSCMWLAAGLTHWLLDEDRGASRQQNIERPYMTQASTQDQKTTHAAR